jgi:hypothetical protein
MAAGLVLAVKYNLRIVFYKLNFRKDIKKAIVTITMAFNEYKERLM